jgi:hypothetical protein
MYQSFREQLLLDRIGKALGRSDPRLASMLAMFSLLTVAKEMPDLEQLHAPGDWIEAAQRAAAIAASMLIGWAAALTSWAAALRARVRWARRAAHSPADASAATRSGSSRRPSR